MSIAFLPCDDPIPLGVAVVIDQTTFKVREAEITDDESLFVGVSYPKTGTSGRICANADGFCFMDFDYFTYEENFQLKDPLTPNSNWNPSIDVTGDNFCLVCSSGLAAVSVESLVAPRWIKVRDGVEYDAYIIR